MRKRRHASRNSIQSAIFLRIIANAVSMLRDLSHLITWSLCCCHIQTPKKRLSKFRIEALNFLVAATYGGRIQSMI